MTLSDFYSHTDDYMSFAPRLDISTWVLPLKPDMKTGKVKVMSEHYTVPSWAAAEGKKILAIRLLIGVQAT